MNRPMLRPLLLAALLSLSGLPTLFAAANSNVPDTAPQHYQDSTWQPRGVLPADDALNGFWPASPKAAVNYDGPGFSSERLSAVPAPGVHPRVLVTPSDVEKIRSRLALGDRAPLEFRVLWERIKKSQSAFSALVTRDDALGKSLARELALKAASLEAKLDRLDQQPDHDNLWAAERSSLASGNPSPPTEIWSLIDYDYLHDWMTPAEREQIRRVVARLTAHRISNFMSVPDHFMINNHLGFGMEFIRLQLLIEGEKGFDPAVFHLASGKARAMLDWYLSDEGMCYESIKGWLNTSAFVSVGLRERDLLRHSHLRAKMRFFQAALRWEDGAWQIRDEMRASAFHVIWMMHYYYPENPGYDLLYSASLSTHDFLRDTKARWPNPVGICDELLLLYATGVARGADGKVRDWTDQARIDSLKFPITWQDPVRGYVDTRNSWRKDDLHLGFTCKQDFFYGGHEGSECNRLTLWHGGVNWIRDLNMLAVKATFLQNMLTVDGKGLSWPPCPGVWLGTRETPEGLIAVGDGKIGYSYSKVMQVHPLDAPSAKLPYYAPFAEKNYDLTRDLQIAFHPGTVKYNDGYAHTDYGAWSGETRMVESYRTNNLMEQAYRTVYLARGTNPYVLVVDDARKDGLKHLFEWNISLPEDVELLDAKTPEVAFQSVEPMPGREGDLLLTRPNTPRDPATGKLLVKNGDPLFLVRVLWRNSPYGFPIPRLERFNGSPEKPFGRFSHLTIPAFSESPEFRILLYPHRQGDPLPVTQWNRDRTELTVQIKEQKDVYRFAQADGGRTVFSLSRNDRPVIDSGAPPARPVLLVHGRTWDINDQRTTRIENQVPEYHFGPSLSFGFVRPPAPAQIRYTLDGSEPSTNSPLYEGPFTVEHSVVVKARRFDPEWPGARRESETVSARLVQVPPATGQTSVPGQYRAGILARVYEKKTVVWNDRGFFDAARNMLPDLDRETPLLTTSVNEFQLPHAVPAHPVPEQCKGFYRFTGWYSADEPGVYEFAVNSCGPVRLELGGQMVIDAAGVFHQQQSVRRGEAVLSPGWHAFDLVVCDPLFWNLTTADPMPFSVSVRRDSLPESIVPSTALCFQAPAVSLQSQPAPSWHEAGSPPAWLEPGARSSSYDRAHKNNDPDYLDLDGLEPLHSEKVNTLVPNLRPDMVRCYDAWFYAPNEGVYRFDLPPRRTENAGLGELRAAYQSQLRVDGEVVVQRGIAGRMPLKSIGLKPGWHALSLRLGSSPAEGSVTYPDGQTLPLTLQMLSRPVQVDIRPGSNSAARSAYEIFGPTSFTLGLPQGYLGEIHYTRDGRLPELSDPVYTAPISLNDTVTLTATAFAGGKAVTAPVRATLTKVAVPQADRMASAVFDLWNGAPGQTTLDPVAQVFILPGAHRVPGRAGSALAVNRQAPDSNRTGQSADVNMTHAPANNGFKIAGLRMRENALTIGLWFSSDTDSGKLFGKEGYTPFGKAFKTIGCSLSGGRVICTPGRVSGGKVSPKTWNHLVIAVDENVLTIYLNGAAVAEGPGCPTLATDSFDFFNEHPALIDRVALYNRVLSADDISHWYQQESSIER